MSQGSATSGQEYVVEIHPTDILSVVYKINGKVVTPSNSARNSSGGYTITFSASQVTPPGSSIVITEGSDQLHCAAIG